MPPLLKAYSPAGAELTATTPKPRKGSNQFQHRAGEDGSGSATVPGDIDPAALDESTIWRINDGTRDLFAFLCTEPTRRALDGPGVTEVDLSGPGVRAILHRAQLLQEDTSDCAEPADTRWLGWQSKYYDSSGWGAPVSFGTFLSGPWVDARPENWVQPLAEYISIDLDPIADATDWGAIATITLDDEGDFIPCIAADDEYRLWIDGREVLSTIGGGPFQWQRYQQQPLKLCAGDHTIAVQVRNLQRPAGLESTNFSWLIFALARAGSDGKPQAANQRYAVYHDHTGGTFTLSSTFGETSAAIAHDADAATVQAALEALATIGAGNVTVSGSGSVSSPWMVEFGGDLASKRIPLTANGASLTGGTAIEVDEHVRGRSASSVLVSNTTDWVVQDFTAGVPGMTPGHMLRVALEEAQERGTTDLDHVTLGCTDTLDTDGQALAEVVLPVQLPADIHRLAALIEELGFQIEMAPDLTLNLWANRGTDLSATLSIAAHTAGIANFASKRSEGAVANVFRVRTDQGWHEATDAASIADRGRWESGLSLEGFSSEAEADLVTGPLLDQYSTPPRTSSCDIAPEAASVVPYDDAGMADIVACDAITDTGYEQTPMRLVSIGGRFDEASIVYSVELID